MEQYTEMKSAAFVDWDPRGNGMIIATRTGNTTQLHWLEKPLGVSKQLTDFPEPVSEAFFPPDTGKKYFLFTKDAGGGENFQVFRDELGTGESLLLTDGKSLHMGIKFSPKGDRIAYANNSRTGMLFDVYVMDPEKPADAKMV